LFEQEEGPFMVYSLMVLAMHAVEVMFFVGLSGCLVVVVVSWISILKEGLSDDSDLDRAA
jgi:hypothetical protein